MFQQKRTYCPHAIMLKLDGSPPLVSDLLRVHPLLLVEPLLGLLEGRDLLLLGCYHIQILEHLRQAPSEPLEDIFHPRGGIHVLSDVRPRIVPLLEER